MKKLLGVFLATIILLTCNLAFADITTTSNGNYIEVDYSLKQTPGESENNMLRIAVMYARRALIEEIGNLQITSDTTVQNERIINDTIGAKIDMTVNGSRVANNYRDQKGMYHAIIRLPLFGGTNSIANIVLPTDVVAEDFPKPKMTNIKSGSFDASSYTGLIIDCSGMGISTAMLPKIESISGEKIYAFEQVSRQTVVSRGMVTYADSMDSGVNRAGSNPLKITANMVNNCDIVISDEDANKILLANQATNFLKNCLVVIVK